MNRCAVTGAAGFIGSHLCEALLDQGVEVVGIDAFIPYYPEEWKRQNLSSYQNRDKFSFHQVDLRKDNLTSVLDGCDTIFHLAAMPGLLKSWTEFDLYVSCNLNATQRLLEAAREIEVEHFIHGSTSSVYGREATGAETATLQPVSPYGLTKLAAEHLCRAYETTHSLPLTVLRFFSVYGPRQRPDMAYTILIDCLLNGKSFRRFGDGTQTRSNTYVLDCVRAIILAAEKRETSLGKTFNVGGGEVVSLNQVISILEELTGGTLELEQFPSSPGDQRHTAANTTAISEQLGFRPKTPVRDGLQAQVEWFKAMTNDELPKSE